MTLRVALAGAGMAARHHARAWRSIEGATLVAVADPETGRARAFAREQGVDASFEDVARMLAETTPDALDIAAAHDAHGSLCRLSAEAGVPFLCQKPLAPTLVEAEAIVADVGARVRWAVHENWCFRPWYREIARRVAADAIGELRRIDMLARGSGLLPGSGGIRPALERQPMLARIRRLALGEVGVHHLDVAIRLAGPCDLEFVALGHDVDAVHGESRARLALRSRGGVRLAIDVDLASPGAPERVDDIVAIEGAHGTIRFDGRRLEGGGPAVDYDAEGGYDASYRGALADFARALGDGSRFATPPEAHLAVLRLVEEAYLRAAASR